MTVCTRVWRRQIHVQPGFDASHSSFWGQEWRLQLLWLYQQHNTNNHTTTRGPAARPEVLEKFVCGQSTGAKGFAKLPQLFCGRLAQAASGTSIQGYVISTNGIPAHATARLGPTEPANSGPATFAVRNLEFECYCQQFTKVCRGLQACRPATMSISIKYGTQDSN